MKRQDRSCSNTILKPKKTITEHEESFAIEDKIYRDFIVPYGNNGSLGLPELSKFMEYSKLLEAKYKKTKAMRFKLYDAFIGIIEKDKNCNIARHAMSAEVESLRKYKNEAIQTIRRLESGKSDETPEDRGLEGKVEIVMHNFKPLLYGQASLNIYFAWYVYVFDSMDFEANKMIQIRNHVHSLNQDSRVTGSDDAYNTLIKLLDEKYETVSDSIKNYEENTESDINIEAENVVIQS